MTQFLNWPTPNTLQQLVESNFAEEHNCILLTVRLSVQKTRSALQQPTIHALTCIQTNTQTHSNTPKHTQTHPPSHTLKHAHARACNPKGRGYPSIDTRYFVHLLAKQMPVYALVDADAFGLEVHLRQTDEGVRVGSAFHPHLHSPALTCTRLHSPALTCTHLHPPAPTFCFGTAGTYRFFLHTHTAVRPWRSRTTSLLPQA